MSKTMRRLASALLALATLSGCNAITAIEKVARPLEIYELRAPAIEPATRAPRNVELVVEKPFASGALATERVMIRPTPLQAQYLPDVRWADTAPVMLQTLMVRSLGDAGAFATVSRRPAGTVGDFTLQSELTDFQAETSPDGTGATVRIRLVARLIGERNRSVLATRTFSASEPAPATDPDSVVAAFDAAAARLLSELVPWLSDLIGPRG